MCEERVRKRLREATDDLLERNGYYRKHVEKSVDSIFRAVADLHYSSQRRSSELKDLLLGLEGVEESYTHWKAEFLGQHLGVNFRILNSRADSLEAETLLLVGEEGSYYRLCFTPPSQYDPIHEITRIKNESLVQSIIYQIIYQNIFKIEFVMEAAERMLHGYFDPLIGKPEVYDKTFSGTAIEALDQFIIPFPYKVAKTLDPSHYRNIDFDVWTSSVKRPSINLSPGILCRFQTSSSNNSIGVFMGLAKDRKYAQVYVPQSETNYYVKINEVEPLDHPERFFESSKRDFGEIQTKYTRELLKRRNMNLHISIEDPHWLTKFDPAVPPPPPAISQPYLELMAHEPLSSPFTVKSVYPILGECPPFVRGHTRGADLIDVKEEHYGDHTVDMSGQHLLLLNSSDINNNASPPPLLSPQVFYSFPTPCMSPICFPWSTVNSPTISPVFTSTESIFQWPVVKL